MKSTGVGEAVPSDPIGGKPPQGTTPSVTDFKSRILYQRAFDAVLWSMPAIAVYGFHRAAAQVGAGPNVILSFSEPARPNLEALTGNNQTPYVTAQTDLRDGPVVLEVPPATEIASLYGQIVDHWQITIADIGPSGIDAGAGGKILLTPPGFNGQTPPGYLEVKSPSYRVAFAFRSVPGPSGSARQAYEYTLAMKMCYLSELPDPSPTRFIDPVAMRYSTLPTYDETWFDDLHAIVSVENSDPRDKVMMGMLATLGIEKDKSFDPGLETRAVMRQAAVDAYHYLFQRFLRPEDASRRWWPDKHWYDGLFCDPSGEFSYEDDDRIDIDDRADRYFVGTFFPKRLGPRPATQYLFPLADADGNELQAGKNYSFTMPADVPVDQFWSLIVYDLETFAFIYSRFERAGLSSFDLPRLQRNSDGSVTIYFGPQPPQGLEDNWIPTSGKRPLPTVRFYGGTEEFWNRSWTMPDVVLID